LGYEKKVVLPEQDMVVAVDHGLYSGAGARVGVVVAVVGEVSTARALAM